MAKEAECTDQKQHIFIKLLEQSKSFLTVTLNNKGRSIVEQGLVSAINDL